MERKISIEQTLCRGCNLCVEMCPKKVFEDGEEISPEGFKLKKVANPTKCTGCKLCELFCPGAINLKIEEKETPSYSPRLRLGRGGPPEARLARGGWRETKNPLTPGKYFWQGNKAVVEAALACGCRFFAGYPITPANEILEEMAKRMKVVDGVMVQAEDEIAAISMILGASWAGLKAITATSGPGFALMQENLSLADMTETPCVVVDVQRAGPSTGQPTRPGAMDMREVRYGSHGAIQRIVLYPESVQELYDLTIKAFNLSERFRTPVILLSDAYLAHLSESVEIKEKIDAFDRIYIPGEPPFGPTPDFSTPSMPRFGDGEFLSITGSTHDKLGARSTADSGIQEELISHLQNKIIKQKEELVDCEELFLNDAKIVVVAFGTVGRSAKWAVREARKRGKKVGFLRPRIVYPFPADKIKELSGKVRKFVVPEMNQGQMFYVVREKISREVVSLPQPNGQIIDPRRILKYLLGEGW
ncbi:MAG: 2-oxoglutarate synthase subunit alpha [Parcubacteria group bacterium CG11_big_fil_rev_8_21_14_0_20_39_14]|nr:MAG: 2-oxoglutarate synthase subunit alpha [Parcubacteria group bacterium CG11_big_fil_rev_8_21_14_0_20_39_14]PIS35339.1 MAG: 2-oxoglutarate synthase subunit alpha [Parcubacteria group bacterium CG08_land_8_20_14_0_20_38_56]